MFSFRPLCVLGLQEVRRRNFRAALSLCDDAGGKNKDQLILLQLDHLEDLNRNLSATKGVAMIQTPIAKDRKWMNKERERSNEF